ncbi:hypothetical protein E2C01_045050 [Portunus trituberculatus]|uniref:Uncharacterized protein n=1 Tax=Portunus trituberculatus TaxID=210409 RepID=A0A5B7G235_PORTR|nr:hypothetical protein [Portunus trituberculatus]
MASGRRQEEEEEEEKGEGEEEEEAVSLSSMSSLHAPISRNVSDTLLSVVLRLCWLKVFLVSCSLMTR